MPDSSDNVNYGVRASGTVDWSRPIEAVHEDGSVIKAYHTDAMVAGDQSRWVKAVFDDGSTGHWFNLNGGANHTRWRIRNVQPTTPEIEPALWDRMVAREVTVPVMSEDDVIDGRFAKYNDYGPLTAITEALRDLGIVREKPVDPDLIEAREVVIAMEYRPLYSWEIREGKNDDHALVRVALAAIKRGRELAAPEVSHVG